MSSEVRILLLALAGTGLMSLGFLVGVWWRSLPWERDEEETNG